VSCLNEQQFFDCAFSSANESPNFGRVSRITSVVDIDTSHFPRFVFRLKLDSGEDAFLKMANCGGCPGFLALWDVIVAVAERVRGEEKKESGSQVHQEFRMVLLGHLREISKVVFQGLQAKITEFSILETNEPCENSRPFL
jgi:hypothetical protein